VHWHCWLGGRKGIQPIKKLGDGGGGQWLVRMEWRPSAWSVCLPLLISPCTIKSRSFLLALANPGGPGKRAVTRLWCDTISITDAFVSGGGWRKVDARSLVRISALSFLQCFDTVGWRQSAQPFKTTCVTSSSSRSSYCLDIIRCEKEWKNCLDLNQLV